MRMPTNWMITSEISCCGMRAESGHELKGEVRKRAKGEANSFAMCARVLARLAVFYNVFTSPFYPL